MANSGFAWMGISEATQNNSADEARARRVSSFLPSHNGLAEPAGIKGKLFSLLESGTACLRVDGELEIKVGPVSLLQRQHKAELCPSASESAWQLTADKAKLLLSQAGKKPHSQRAKESSTRTPPFTVPVSSLLSLLRTKTMMVAIPQSKQAPG